jgi:hypothetical protein
MPARIRADSPLRTGNALLRFAQNAFVITRITEQKLNGLPPEQLLNISRGGLITASSVASAH